jgi:hypothetical protein
VRVMLLQPLLKGRLFTSIIFNMIIVVGADCFFYHGCFGRHGLLFARSSYLCLLVRRQS